MQDILFNEKEHKYYDNFGNTYISVTTIIGKYTDTFNPYYWGMFTGLKDNGYDRLKPDNDEKFIIIAGVKYKIEDLHKDTRFKAWYEFTVAKWNVINIEACDRGNATHNELENNINISKGDYSGGTNGMILPNSGKSNNGFVISTEHDLSKTNLEEKYPEVYNRLIGYINRGCSIFAEKRVFLESFRVAGMIDVPIIKGNKFCILDWKTNKDTLHKTSGYYRKQKVNGMWVKTTEWIENGKCFKYPLNNLQCSKFNIYALQLSLYAYILEQWGFILAEGGLEIMHFPLGEKPKLIKIPYLKEEVEIMLNHYKHSA